MTMVENLYIVTEGFGLAKNTLNRYQDDFAGEDFQVNGRTMFCQPSSVISERFLCRDIATVLRTRRMFVLFSAAT